MAELPMAVGKFLVFYFIHDNLERLGWMYQKPRDR